MENKMLKFCPFCKGSAKINKSNIYKNIYSVSCTICGAETTTYDTEDEAINAWNKRVNEIPVGNGENYEVSCK